jgi:hypothetical protein
MTALLLLLLTFLLPFFSRELRRGLPALFTFWAVVALHHGVAITNSFLFHTIGAEYDATGFSNAGFELAQAGMFPFSIGSKLYESFLGVIYWLFGSSHFLGAELSVLAFSLSCIVLLKILRQLNFQQYQMPALLFFGALPTMVFVGSVTMRESLQVFFFMLAVYYGIEMHLKGGFNRNFIMLVLSAFAMGLTHKGLIVYMFFLIMAFLLFSLQPTSKMWRVKKLRLLLMLMLPIFLLVLLVLANLDVQGIHVLHVLANMDVLEAASYHREFRGDVGRTTYGILLDLSSLASFSSSISRLYIYYMFMPFPWKISNLLDVYAGMEALLRLLLLYCAAKEWYNAEGERRRLLTLLFIIFFAMSLLWALGTINYGTGMRHHMVTWWLLIVLGMPQLVQMSRKFVHVYF